MHTKMFFILLILFFLTHSSCFELFPVEKRVISKVNFDDKICYKAYSISTGATTNEVIQIWYINKPYEKLISTYSDFDSAYLSIYGKTYLIITLLKGNLEIATIDTINTVDGVPVGCE